jgi:CBS domain containing-hemolysin-like protein
MSLSILLFFVALALSSFFSGTETGMYRVSRIRLVLDALSGSWLSRGMVWLLNYPTIFVATALIGNNLANYLVSLSIVMLTPMLFPGEGVTAELLGTVLMTPIVFVFGELLPKYLFYHAPYRLLYATRPLLIAFTILFTPVSLFLGLLGNLLRLLTGETPIRLRLSMQRSELEQVLRQGHEAGVIAAGQRHLAKNVFEIGNQPAIRFGVTPERLAVVQDPVSIDEAKKQAHRKGQSIVLVQRRKRIIGFLRFVELEVDNQIVIRPIVRCEQDESHMAVLYKLYDAKTDVAVLVDSGGRTQAVVTRRQLQRSFMASQAPGL